MSTTSLHHAVAGFALSMALLAPSAASALGNRVVINCRHGELTCADDFTAFTNALESQGAVVDKTWDDDSGSPLFDLSSGDVRLLVVALPFAEWSIPIRTQQIPSFLSQGGRIVLLGEGETGSPDTNDKLRDILGSIPDHGLTLEMDQEHINGSCTDPPTTMIQGDPITAGLSQWHIAQAATVSGGDALINFTTPSGTSAVAAVGRLPSGGEIILFGDTEGFIGGAFHSVCSGAGVDVPAAHMALWTNLYNDQSGALDSDGDGYDSDVDCNDNNPNVNPGVDEECNGLDDNCDGTIDEGCGDDDDATGSDDDDATGSDDDDAGSDDDDSTTGSFDDDDSSDPFRDDSGWSSCSCGDGGTAMTARPSSALWAVLPLGGLLGWRRRRSRTTR